VGDHGDVSDFTLVNYLGGYNVGISQSRFLPDPARIPAIGHVDLKFTLDTKFTLDLLLWFNSFQQSRQSPAWLAQW